MGSDVVPIVLFLLMLLVPVALVVGLAMHFGKKSGKRRTGGTESHASSFNDISNILD